MKRIKIQNNIIKWKLCDYSLMDFIFRRKYNQQSQICIISREHGSVAFGRETECRKYQEMRGNNLIKGPKSGYGNQINERVKLNIWQYDMALSSSFLVRGGKYRNNIGPTTVYLALYWDNLDSEKIWANYRLLGDILCGLIVKRC